MAKTTHRTTSRSAHTIGRDAFEKISAVEGIVPTAEARARTRRFDEAELSPEQRVKAIVEAYRTRAV